MTTGGKLKTPLGGWINPTHRIWHWYYNKDREELYHISGTTIKYFKRAIGWQCTRLTTTFVMMHVESSAHTFPFGAPTLVIRASDSKTNKLQEGLPPLATPDNHTLFWTFIAAWGGNWIWRNINNSDTLKDNMQWVTDGMIAGHFNMDNRWIL
jgi:hypothetical protein